MSAEAGFKDHFSGAADAYRRSRPGYPDALFEWLSSLPAGAGGTAWDCGCGNGQASVGMAAHMARVIASDPSAKQIESAEPHARVDYRTAPAETVPIADGTIDLTLAAQAAHWFDLDAFYAEVRRVSRPGAVVALVTYGPFTADGALGEALEAFYAGPIHAHWPPERAHVEAGYRTLPFPFAEIAAPAFAMTAEWDFARLIDYIGTWSAVKACRDATGTDPIPAARKAIAAAWGEPAAMRTIRWPLSLRVGRV